LREAARGPGPGKVIACWRRWFNPRSPSRERALNAKIERVAYVEFLKGDEGMKWGWGDGLPLDKHLSIIQFVS
jgi:hypothetical protein